MYATKVTIEKSTVPALRGATFYVLADNTDTKQSHAYDVIIAGIKAVDPAAEYRARSCDADYLGAL